MKDVEIIAMYRTYVNQTLVGMGALKGAPCTVQGTVDNGDGTQTLTLKWTDTDGVSHTSDIILPSAMFDIDNPTNGQTIRYNSTSGKWENSNVSFSADLEDLDNVVITSVQDGQVLTYDAANNRWINADGSTVAALSDLTDVTITTAQNGQLLSYNSALNKWVNISLNIDDLGHVSITSATDGQVLTYDAANSVWKNTDLPTITVDSALDTTSENPVQNKVIALAMDQLSASRIGFDGTASGLSASDVQGAVDELASEKVDKETGKGLSANDFTDILKNKLDGIEEDAEVNDIDTVKVNGTALTPDANKAVDILLNMTKLSDVDLTGLADANILIYDAANNKWFAGANTGATYTAGEGIEIDQNNVITSKIVLFTGTDAQWEALPLADKIKFTHYATTDTQSGQIDPVPTQNSANLMTSGGIWTALQLKANTADLGTAAAKDSTNAVTQSSTDLVESGAVYSALADKADKVTGATANNFAGLDANGNLQDSGKKASDFATAEGLANEAETRAKLGAHNLLNIFNSEINVSGTYTEVVNSDGTVTIGGTPTSACTIPYKATALYNGSVYNLEPSTNYVLDSGLSVISPLNIQVFTKANASASWTKIAETTTNTSLSFTTPSSFYDVWARILVPANADVPANTVVKPQIRLATDAYSEYTPYAPKNADCFTLVANDILGAHNLINIDNFQRGPSHGLTLTVNSDKSVTVSGTHDLVSGTTGFRCYGNIVKAGTYSLDYGVTTIGAVGVYLNDSLTSLGNYKTLTSSGAGLTRPLVFTVTENDLQTYPLLVIEIGISYTVKNVDITYYPLLKSTSDPSNVFTPFSMTNQQLTERMSVPIIFTPTGSAVDSYTAGRCRYARLGAYTLVQFHITLTSTAVSGPNADIIKASDIGLSAWGYTQFAIGYGSNGSTVRIVANENTNRIQLENNLGTFPASYPVYGQMLVYGV